MKKTLCIFLIVIAIMLACSTNIFAANNFTTQLDADKKEAKEGETVTVTLSISNITLEEGINSLLMKLEYDKDFFEPITKSDVTTLSPWGGLIFNEAEGKLTLDSNEMMKQESNVLSITFKLKDNITKSTGNISFKDVSGSDGEVEIPANDITTTISKFVEKPAPDTNNVNDTNATNNVNDTKNKINVNKVNNNTQNTAGNKNKVDNTNAQDNIPKAGDASNIVYAAVIGGVVICAVAIYAYVRYKKM